jgi:2-dehydro-3-deoxyphosphogluconate aldolase / (4S)-4-hydroxy-2-oxoglutarate aldolase
MKNLTRQEVYQQISNHAFLPLFNPYDLEVSKSVIKAAYDGGVRVFECTNRSANAFSVFKSLVRFVNDTMPDLVIGAGTIMDEASARNFHEAGAQFIVSPVIRADVGKYCQENNLFWSPGASTLNEIMTAQDMGADLIKIFPASLLGGPKFVKAIMAPCPGIKVMPTGGVDDSEQNLRAWFEAGVVSVGMGSQLFTKELLGARDYDKVMRKTREIVNKIKMIKSSLGH